MRPFPFEAQVVFMKGFCESAQGDCFQCFWWTSLLLYGIYKYDSEGLMKDGVREWDDGPTLHVG